MSFASEVRKRRIKRLLWAGALVLLASSVLLLHFKPGLRESLRTALPFLEMRHASPGTEGKLSVHFLDVGQGDAALILTPDGKAILVDCGPPDSQTELTEYLSFFGVSEIDCLILTHPHPDHIGGALAVLNHFSVKQVLMSDAQTDTTLFAALSETIREASCPVSHPGAGDTVFFGEVTLFFLGPTETDDRSLNDDSLVFRLSYRETSFLFTGDAESEEENGLLAQWAASDLSADVLKVGHHGSSTSTGLSFLESVDPSYAVISCGKANEYGHPHSSVLAALTGRSVSVFRTDESGTVIFISDGNTLTVEKPFTRP